ncbi:MAG: sigma-70 family RNA polymerase sigma factor [Pseudomonadota bacterium]
MKSTVEPIVSATAEEANNAGTRRSVSNSSASDPRIQTLYEECADELIAGVRQRFGEGPPDPADVIHESFRRVYEQRNTAEIVNLKAYVWRVARNLVLDVKKTETTRGRYDFEVEHLLFPLRGEHGSPEITLAAEEQLRAISQCVAQMPDTRRRAFLLYRLEGLTLLQVSKRLNMSVSGVRKHVSRAQGQLHALFTGPARD